MKFQKLGQHILQIRGIAYKPEDIISEPIAGYVPIIKSNNITEDGFESSNLIFIKRDYIRPEQFVKRGDIVLTASSGSKKTIGKNIQFDSDYDGSFGAFCKLIRPKATVNQKYLYHFFKTRFFRETIEKKVQGANISNLRNEHIDNLRFRTCSIEDQIRIATILTRAERLIAKRKDSMKALDELLKSTFLKMFGDPKTNPKQFAVDKLKNLYIDPRNGTKCGPFGSALKKAEFVADGIPVWNMDNISASGQMVMPFRMWITEDKYYELESYSVIDGDVIISRAGTVGKMCVAKMHNEKSIISTNLIRIRFGKRILPIYFVSLMNYCKGRVGRLKTGPDGSFTHMNTGVLDVLEFPIPLIELQNQFAAIVEKIESIKARYTQSLEELENLYGSLSQRAFKGELDLSKVPLEQEHHMIEVSDEGTAEEIIMTEVPASKTYSDAELMDIIRKIPGGKFTFSSLMDEIKKADFDEMPEYEKIKTYLYQMLDEANPRLSQVFDEEDKQIVLRVDP